MDEPLGLRLQQAFEQYTDREAWLALCSAAKRKNEYEHHRGRLRITIRRVSEWGDDEPSDVDKVFAAFKRAETAVERDFFLQLYKGELIATGIECPPRIDSARKDIPRHLFRILRPRYEESSLVGPEIKIVDVLIRRASDNVPVLEHEIPTALLGPGKAGTVGDDVDEAKIDNSCDALRGRPGLQADFQRELRRRAEARELCGSLAQEALYLRKWGDRNGFRNPAGKPWAITTIENKLRGLYRDLKA